MKLWVSQRIRACQNLEMSQVVVLIMTSLIAISCLYFLLAIKTHQVEGQSMMPTLENGDRLFITKGKMPERYALITFAPDQDKSDSYVKRVIGMPKDRIWLDGNSLYILPGWSISEQTLQPEFNSYLSGSELPNDTLKLLVMPEVARTLFHLKEIPEGQYFVLGDNRTHSNDSRHLGLIKEEQIEGVVSFRYYPFSRIGGIH